MNDGTLQSQRRPAALAGAEFRVDEFDFATLLSMTAAYAACLRFADVDGQDSGHWGEMFDGHEVVGLARLCSLDLDGEEAAFVRAADSGRTDAMAERVRALDERLRRACGPQAVAGSRLPAGGVYSLVAEHAQKQLHELRAAADPAQRPPDPALLRAAFFALVGAARRLQALSRDAISAAQSPGDLPPALGLVVALLQVYGRVQAAINTFPDRHCDFYYDECLRMGTRAAEPGRMHFVLAHAGGAGAVTVPAGTRLVGAAGAPGRFAEYATERELLLTDARVGWLGTLRLERHPMIAPECTLGYVTRVIAGRIDDGAGTAARPMFGGSTGELDDAGSEARLGWAVSAPVLWLAQGTRHVSLTLRLAPADDADADAPRTPAGPTAVDRLVQAMEQAPTADDLRRAAGRVFARWLLDPADRSAPGATYRPYSDAQMQALRRVAAARLAELTGRSGAAAATAGNGPAGPGTPAGAAAASTGAAEPPGPVDPLRLFVGEVPPDRELMFDALLSRLFLVEMSTAQGWHVVATATLRRSDPDTRGLRGLTLQWQLRAEDPPIVACSPQVHGEGWSTEAPTVRLTIHPNARLHPLSLLQGTRLAGVELDVRVRGLRDLRLYNQLGRLDGSKPFAPFGPLPDLSSYLVVGAPEIARKPLAELRLHVDWGGLPGGAGGFARHYAAYGRGWDNAAYTVRPSILRHGTWAGADDASRVLRLFDTADDEGRLSPSSGIALDPAHVRTRWSPDAAAPGLDEGARGGYFKLQLASPEEGFGHAAYASLLTRTLTQQIRRRRAPEPPPTPYTPMAERVWLDYAASTRVRFGADAAGAGAGGLQLLRLHPFGMEPQYPGAVAGPLPLLPEYTHDGHLYIGLEGTRLEGPLSLLFELREDLVAHAPVQGRAPPDFQWAVLGERGWERLDTASVLDDTTAGFRTTGVVTLELPPPSPAATGAMPAGHRWLRLSTDGLSDRVAGLRGVQAQAVAARRVGDAGTGTDAPPAGAWQPAVALPGLAGVAAAGTARGARAAETPELRRVRIGERLWHKQRACTPWDYERLVLAAFPSVHKVRCFPVTASASRQPRAGSVLVVVVPALPGGDPALRTRPHHLSVVELQRIADHLRPLCSDTVDLQVRNAAYERIQVRCTLQLSRVTSPGRVVQEVNEALIEYLSPWSEAGRGPRFEWTLRCEDVEAWICDRVADVRSVSGLSLLQVTEDDQGRFELGDTAWHDGRGVPALSASARMPWSLALPLQAHLIDVGGTGGGEWAPQVTGVDRLGIGETFVVCGDGEPGDAR